jgi:cobalt-precorrin-5B (C1)-methyltransferase
MTGGNDLRRGWTTGACAMGAAKAAYTALLSGVFPDPVEIVLPAARHASFALAMKHLHDGAASAGIVKDAGDDPDVTHGALVCATVRQGPPGTAVTFRAGAGVGTVTKPGLPLAIGEPAINSAPRRMIAEAIAHVAQAYGGSGDAIVEISIPDGERIAQRTLNPRLGILGGLSILGTTGVVIPYSCSAWIAGIYEGIDVARALGITHVAGATGKTSEAAVARHYNLPESALIDMGDFVGAMLRHLRAKPIPRVTIAGGFAKMCKLAQGEFDLHSARSRLNMKLLARFASDAGATPALQAQIAIANTGLEALQLAQAQDVPVGDVVAREAREQAFKLLRSEDVTLDVLVVDRDGNPIACAS